MHTMTLTSIAAPTVPEPQPIAYQHRHRLLCAACFARTRRRPRRYGNAVIPVPAPASGRLPVARRACAGCGVELPIPGLFGLGQLVATPGELDACEAALVSPRRLLARHWSGDWGDISGEDHGLNEDAIRDGARVFSVYGLQGGGRVYIITEADRHATTLLLPSEY